MASLSVVPVRVSGAPVPVMSEAADVTDGAPFASNSAMAPDSASILSCGTPPGLTRPSGFDALAEASD